MYSTFIKPLMVIYNFLRESFLGVLIDLSLVYFLRVMNRNMYYMYLHWPVNCFHCLGYFIAATSSCHPDLILNETINNFPFNCQNGKLISHDHCHICWTYLGTKQEGEKGLIRPPHVLPKLPARHSCYPPIQCDLHGVLHESINATTPSLCSVYIL